MDLRQYEADQCRQRKVEVQPYSHHQGEQRQEHRCHPRALPDQWLDCAQRDRAYREEQPAHAGLAQQIDISLLLGRQLHTGHSGQPVKGASMTTTAQIRRQ